MPEHNQQPKYTALKLLKRGDISTFLRYAVVGGAQNAFFYGLTLILLSFHFQAWQALVVVYPVAVAISFAANRSWSFRDRGQSSRQFRNYVMVYLMVYPLAIAFTWLQEHAGIPSWCASLITMGIAAVGIFFALNHWVFRNVKPRTSMGDA